MNSWLTQSERSAGTFARHEPSCVMSKQSDVRSDERLRAALLLMLAMGSVLAAGLSRKGLEALIAEQPRTAAKLMMGVAQRIADRLRALGQQLHMMAEITGGPRGRPRT